MYPTSKGRAAPGDTITAKGVPTQRRRLRTAAAAFLLATGGLGIGTAHAGDNVSQTCAEVNNPLITHGACVAGANGNATPLLSNLCELDGFQQATGTTNRGQCLKVLKSVGP